MDETKPKFFMDTEKHLFKQRSYRWQIVLLLVLSIELVAALAHHRSKEELQNQLRGGNDHEQVEALFILTNRDQPDPFSEEELQGFSKSGNPLLREWLMTSNFSRFTTTKFEKTLMKSVVDSVESERFRFYYTHRIGKKSDMTLAELAAFLSK